MKLCPERVSLPWGRGNRVVPRELYKESRPLGRDLNFYMGGYGYV
jgi:hypothetical protein